ncbi:MAG: arginine--tRNA ligase [Nitrososphaerales archaeon]
MSFRDFVDEASYLTREACNSLGYEVPASLDWDIPPSKELGDASFRVGYQLTKTARKSPAQIAGEIAGQIEGDYAKKKQYVSSAEGHPSGFLNFRFNKSVLFSAVLNRATTMGYGALNIGKGQRVLIEHTSVNPNKALHVGHLRNVALGDSIRRIFQFTNYDVKVLNYIDDSGLQVADVLVGIKYLGFSKENSIKKFDHYAGDDIYVVVNKRYETDPSLAEKRRVILKGIEEHDKDIFSLASEITEKILVEQLKTCWRFNASYDLLVFESDIISSRLWEDAFQALKTNGIAKLETVGTFEGCWVVTIKGEKEGEDKVLVRSDGTATYVAKDIPFAALKVGVISDRFTYDRYAKEPDGHQVWRTNASKGGEPLSPVKWGADKSITAIGSEQSRLQRVILRVLEQLARTDMSGKYIHLGYSLMSLSPKTVASLMGEDHKGNPEEPEKSSGVRMSGRRGLYVNADDVFDAVKKSALEETRKRNPDGKDEWLDYVSDKIAISAVRFSLLKQDLDKTITFDLEESLKLMGETGPYMLYTYARANSILSKVGEAKPKKINASLLSSETEADLMSLISKFDLFVEKSVKMLAPKWIAHYSFELCEAFNKFYEKNRVIQVENEEIRASRIELVRAFQHVLKRSLDLLGIDCLPKI